MNIGLTSAICSSPGCGENGGSSSRKRVTVYDIARSVGVSHTTVARALRDSKDVAKKRRQEIQRIALEMGYYPDPHLAALANYRKTLAPSHFKSVVAWLNHWQKPDQLRKFGEFERYWQGAQEVAGRQGFKLEDFRWSLDCSPKRLESVLLARGIE
ncbi:MAG TPA: LacI family DNA-binding transcriptional regulator, partial [Verrucomicrobiae bacterium]|nr:LacI family DNA-binding transcriptional regulator [Verrucomicrobiae bacterium]